MFASIPGVTSWLFDDTDEIAQAQAIKAEKKADVAYETLAEEVKEIKGENRQLSQRVQNQYNVIMLLLQKGIGVEGPSEVDIIHDIVNTPVHEIAPPVRPRARRASGAGGMSNAAPMADLVPSEVIEEMIEDNEQQHEQEQRPALPDDLDGLL